MILAYIADVSERVNISEEPFTKPKALADSNRRTMYF